MLFLAAIAFLILCIAAAGVLARLERSGPAWPVFARPVMTAAELEFYARLAQAVPDLRIFPQVQLCRFIEVQSGPKRTATLNRYDRLSADFVVARADGTVLCVIELDDASHERRVVGKRDAKKSAVLSAAGIPLLRFRAGRLPDAMELAAQVKAAASATGPYS